MRFRLPLCSSASASLLCRRRRWDSFPFDSHIASAVRCARTLAVLLSSTRTRATRIRSASESCQQPSGRPSDAPRPDSNSPLAAPPSLPHLFCLPRHDADLHLSSALAPTRPLAHLSMFQSGLLDCSSTGRAVPGGSALCTCTIALFRPFFPSQRACLSPSILRR